MAAPAKSNNFDSILKRLKKILPKTINIETVHTLRTPSKNYPLIKFSVGNGNFRRALISAGIHGDEPGGIETILKFFENKFYSKYKDSWELTFLPCINPYGYDFGTRENHQRKDLNRLFKIEKPPLEVLFAQSILDSKFDLTMELHEDNESSGYYLYQKETNPKYQQLGIEILSSIEKIMPINTDNEIDGSTAHQGIIDNDLDLPNMDWWPMALYGISRGVQTSLTLEAASRYKLTSRVEAHLEAIKTALDKF
jgi:predicted deacylase